MNNRTEFRLHERLQTDSVLISATEHVEVRLINQSAVQWIILVPYSSATEWVHLEPECRSDAMRLQDRVSATLLNDLNTDKINTALIGNVVEQMHIHVIGRRHDDPFWPDVVWGKPLVPYEKKELESTIQFWQSKLD